MYNNLPFHPTVESVVKILMAKTQNNDPLFFRVMVSYFFTKIASMMRTYIDIPGTGRVPVNFYAINLATSGSGKGHSINVIEDQVIHRFKHKFINETLECVSQAHLAKQANVRSIRNNSDPDYEMDKIKAEYDALGPLPFSFDSGTTAAVKQMRHKLLLADAGSMNMEIDEIGSNLLGNIDVLTSFLELFDMGKIKQKLTKNTKENIRHDEVDGQTPSNMLLFGTPTKLLNGSKIEEEFYEMLEIGYARRSFFGLSKNGMNELKHTAAELLDIFTDTSSQDILIDLSEKLAALADQVNFHTVLTMERDTALYWLQYQIDCSNRAKKFSEYEEVKRAEITHRYFKVAKLAATYAFIDQSPMVEMEHLHNAIALAEQSGEAFNRILTRDRPYVKLAAYIASIGREVTQADLVEDLPFYKGTETQKREMMSLAISHGYKNNMVIKKETIDGIDFFSGSSIDESCPEETILAHSTDITSGYINEVVPFDQLHQLCNLAGRHFVGCHLLDHENTGGYRDEKHVIPRYNMVVIDVDGGTSVDTAKLLLREHKYLIYTTKRHTPEKNRFRLILPLTHYIELRGQEYKDFMTNVYNWLPFEVDRQTNQLSRKWETCPGDYFYNDGDLLDALQFIPKTKNADAQRKFMNKFGSLSNLERWFASKANEGERNNMLMRFAFCLVDMNMDIDMVKDKVLILNSKLEDPLPETEVLSTILVSASKKINERNLEQHEQEHEQEEDV